MFGLVRSRIAIKLTLTLVGFVALTMLLVGLALNRSLESFAGESLEARLRMVAASSLSDTMRQVMLVSGLVAVAVAFAIGVFVARRVTRPVVEMQAIARRMSEGDFAVHAPVRSPDEIGALGRALNVMAGRLRDKIRALEGEQAKATAILDGMVEEEAPRELWLRD